MGIAPINAPVRRRGKTPRTRGTAQAEDRSWATQQRTPGHGLESAHPLGASMPGSPGEPCGRGPSLAHSRHPFLPTQSLWPVSAQAEGRKVLEDRGGGNRGRGPSGEGSQGTCAHGGLGARTPPHPHPGRG